VVIAAVLALGAGGCGKDTIFIAELSDAGIDAAPIVCTLSDAGTGTGCPDGSFCEFSEATKCPDKAPEGTQGTCAPIRSESCANDFSFAPQCGCDGVTYFNECLRRERGVSTASAGPCFLTPLKSCDPARRDDPDCPTCAVIFPSEFSIYFPDAGSSPLACAVASTTAGSCWVTPACTSSSPPSGTRLRSLSCPRPCEDACLAIRAGGPMTTCSADDAGPD
jgi:hypothetical protein